MQRNSRKCQQNDFIDIDFSYDWSVPTTLYVVVYIKIDTLPENGEMEFSFSYLPQDLSCDLYNISTTLSNIYLLLMTRSYNPLFCA